MIKIALVDDHHLVRQGLRALLEDEPDFEIIGEASYRETAIQLVEHSKPAILVLDLMLNGNLDGIEVVHHLNKRSPETGIINFI